MKPGFILIHGRAIPIFRDRHPRHLISFHMLTKRPKLRNANQIALSVSDAVPRGSVYMWGKYRQTRTVVSSVTAHCEA